ncbi:MAG: M23 family metallopeptidase [Candidatus Aenigmarchaeota archaeon]
MKQIHKRWPVPDSYTRNLPKYGAGSFLEYRGKNNVTHRGVDIYSPKGSSVIAPENLEIIHMGIWSTPDQKCYWNETLFALVETESGEVFNFSELDKFMCQEGSKLESGQMIGNIGQILNPDKISSDSPEYIQKLAKNSKFSMLHLERYIADYLKTQEGGEHLVGSAVPLRFFRDPSEYLINCK